MVYAVMSVAIVNVLAAVVVARLGRRLSGTTDELRGPAISRPAHPSARAARGVPPRPGSGPGDSLRWTSLVMSRHEQDLFESR